jgi:hypothetical protein
MPALELMVAAVVAQVAADQVVILARLKVLLVEKI